MWSADVEVESKTGIFRKTVTIVVGSQDIDSLKRNATVLKRALKYSRFKDIEDLNKWKIKSIVIIKKLGLT